MSNAAFPQSIASAAAVQHMSTDTLTALQLAFPGPSVNMAPQPKQLPTAKYNGKTTCTCCDTHAQMSQLLQAGVWALACPLHCHVFLAP